MTDGNDHTGVFISRKALMAMSSETRASVLSAVFGEAEANEFVDAQRDVGASTDRKVIDGEDEAFAELSLRQARRFVEGLKEKTRPAAEAIARSNSRFFQVADVATAVGVPAGDLRGVWGGLTRRTKTVTGDDDAYLIDWSKSEPVHDADGNYIDQTGEITEMTYRSLRKAFGI